MALTNCFLTDLEVCSQEKMSAIVNLVKFGAREVIGGPSRETTAVVLLNRHDESFKLSFY